MSLATLCCRLRLFFLITIFASHSLAQVFIPKYLDCPAPSTNATEDSKFRDNIARLVATLPSSAAATGGFASLSRGNGGDQAFIRGLCRGDTKMGDCQTCLQAAGEELYRNCTTSRRAAIWYEQCFVFFADTNATTAYEESYRQELHNVNSVSNEATFERTYGELMSSLAARVVNGTPEASSAAPLFATGHAVFDRNALNGTMYGLAQCTRDRTAAECGQCLKGSVPRAPKCCYGHQGKVVLGYNCYLRVEVYTYYDLALDARQPPLLAPAPSPPPSIVRVTGKGKRKKGPVVLAVALPIGALLCVVVGIIVVFLYKRRERQKATTQDDGKEEDIGFVDQLEQLNLQLLRTATDNFSEANKLGEGGFGEVFKRLKTSWPPVARWRGGRQ